MSGITNRRTSTKSVLTKSVNEYLGIKLVEKLSRKDWLKKAMGKKLTTVFLYPRVDQTNDQIFELFQRHRMILSKEIQKERWFHKLAIKNVRVRHTKGKGNKR